MINVVDGHRSGRNRRSRSHNRAGGVWSQSGGTAMGVEERVSGVVAGEESAMMGRKLIALSEQGSKDSSRLTKGVVMVVEHRSFPGCEEGSSSMKQVCDGISKRGLMPVTVMECGSFPGCEEGSSSMKQVCDGMTRSGSRLGSSGQLGMLVVNASVELEAIFSNGPIKNPILVGSGYLLQWRGS